MSQHFLLSSKARTLSLRTIYQDGEDKAFETFKRLRWPQTNGQPVCPHCGSLDHYTTARRRFACKDCRKQYSVTSGTIFASRKMAFVDLLAAICIVTNGAKGISALQLARDINCQHKTAFVLAHKLRRVVVAMRQRKGRTLTGVFMGEDDSLGMIQERVKAGSVVYADEASSWDRLHGWYTAKRINHSIAFMDEGVCTNQAESFFSRLRRMVGGQHHKVSAQHLHAYAAHAAWLEDHRRLDNGALAHRALGLAMAHPVSREWAGYWQGRT
jgi:transposase-like protein